MSPDGQFVLVSPHQAAVLAARHRKRVPEGPRNLEPQGRRSSARSATSRSPRACRLAASSPGRAGIRWNPAVPATLLWVEALDGGNPRNQVPSRDKVHVADGAVRRRTGRVRRGPQCRFDERLVDGEGRRAAHGVGPRDPRHAHVAHRRARRGAAQAAGSASQQDRYADPGSPDRSARRAEATPIMQAGDASSSPASGASPQGDRPFLDRLNLKTLATERVFQCDDKSYETVAASSATMASSLLTRWETKTDFPNYYVRDLAAGTRSRPDAVQGPGAATHRHPEAVGDLRPQGRREAVGHGLPAAGLQAGHAPAVRALGLPGRVHRRGHGQPGVADRRTASPPSAGALPPAVPHPGLRRDGQPDHADCRAGRDGQRHVRRAA